MINWYDLYIVSTFIGRKPLILLSFLHFQRIWRWMGEENEYMGVHKSSTMMLIQKEEWIQWSCPLKREAIFFFFSRDSQSPAILMRPVFLSSSIGCCHRGSQLASAIKQCPNGRLLSNQFDFRISQSAFDELKVKDSLATLIPLPFRYC